MSAYLVYRQRPENNTGFGGKLRLNHLPCGTLMVSLFMTSLDLLSVWSQKVARSYRLFG